MRLIFFVPFLLFACTFQRNVKEALSPVTATEMQREIVLNLDSILSNVDLTGLHPWKFCALKTMIEKHPAEINFSHSAINDTLNVVSYFFNDIDMDFAVLKDRQEAFHFFYLPRLREIMGSSSIYKDKSTNGYKELKDDKVLSLISLNEEALDAYLTKRLSHNGGADRNSLFSFVKCLYPRLFKHPVLPDTLLSHLRHDEYATLVRESIMDATGKDMLGRNDLELFEIQSGFIVLNFSNNKKFEMFLVPRKLQAGIHFDFDYQNLFLDCLRMHHRCP